MSPEAYLEITSLLRPARAGGGMSRDGPAPRANTSRKPGANDGGLSRGGIAGDHQDAGHRGGAAQGLAVHSASDLERPHGHGHDHVDERQRWRSGDSDESANREHDR